MEGKPMEQQEAPAAEAREKPASSPEAAPAAEERAPVPEANAAAPAEPKSALPPEEDERLRADIVAALKTVYDPEIPADIYELGLIYGIEIDGDRNVAISMTLTAPACPVAGEMPQWVDNAVSAVPGVASTTVTMTFDPPWDMGRMSDEARLALNMF
jgi:FeS assembly SUF system protein